MEKVPEFNPDEEKSEQKSEYTLEYLDSLKEQRDKDDDGFGPNNPNAGRAKRIFLNRKIREIEKFLKQNGTIEYTEQEKLDKELDTLYPNAKSKTKIEYKGNKYILRYYPLEVSRSGKTVHEWGHTWKLIEK